MPHVATPPADLLEPISPGRPPRRRPPRHRRRAGLPRRRDPRPRLDRRLQRRTRPRPRRPSGSSGRPARRSAPGRRASRTCTWRAPAARSHGFTVPAINIRAQTFDMARTIFETAAARRRRRGHPRARPQRADLHVPAADRLRDRGPGRGDRRGLAGPGLHPGRPLPVQREEVRRRPRGDDRGDPARLPARDRRRLPEHRHRLLDAGRPVEADRRRAAARELHPRRRADRAHPVARDRRRDGQRRRRDRRGRHAELDRRGAARLPRRLSARARRPRAGRARHLARSASRPARATAACRCRTAAWPRSSSTSRSSASSARSPASTGWPGAVQHGASTLPDELFHRFPAVETAEIHLATGFQNALYEHPAFPEDAPPRDRGAGASRTRPTSARPTRPTSSSSTRRARRRSGRSSAQLWDLEPQGRDPRRPASQGRRSCSPSSASTARASMVERYIQPVEVHRPLPDALREARRATGCDRARPQPSANVRVDAPQRGAILPRRSAAG